MGDLLFQRKFRLVVDTIEIKGLDVRFQVRRTLKPEPNRAEIAVWNLNEAHRAALEQKKTAPVLLEAGYQSGTSILFVGDLRTAISVVEGPDIITTLSSGDGEKAIRTARVNVSLKKGTTTEQVLKACAAALGVGEGNLSQAVATLKGAGLATLFSAGTVLSGSAARELSGVCKAAGLSWSIQNGKLQILPLAQALEGKALVISSATGMVGSPTVDNKGVLKVRTLLIPDLFPGRKVVLDAARLKGQYRVESATYVGDSYGADWFVDLEGKRY